MSYLLSKVYAPEELILLYQLTTNSYHLEASLKSVTGSNTCDFFIEHIQNKLTSTVYVTNLLCPLVKP